MKKISSCPICGNKKNFNSKFKYHKKPAVETNYNFFKNKNYSRAYLICNICSHWFSNCSFNTKKFYTGDYKNASYSNYKLTFNKIINLPNKKSDNHYRIKRIDKFIKKRFKIKPKILDIGSGLGIFPYSARIMNYKCDCLDPDPEIHSHLKINAKCNKIYSIDFNEFICKGKYKFITLNKVLEHVDKPIKFIKKLSEILTNDGYVYIELPDTDVANKFGKEREEFSIEHVQAFTLNSINFLLSSNNFIIEKFNRIKEPSGKFTFYIFAKKLIK